MPSPKQKTSPESLTGCRITQFRVDFLHASRPGLGTLNFEQQFAAPSLDELEADRPDHAFYAPG
jgi:hypothetical protein